ncbi:MAG: succinylglutamate desuccinylase/aspartoacylase family protein [Betaproteobacteria bacterium]|nr:MAG: succinylglutamate desuccinylase/aspartoacylase family protein [Betaproteobacteria bacterium]
MLTTLDHIPAGFLEASSGGLHQVIPGPTLIHLAGRKPDPLFVSVLLHGNEYTGLKAIQNVLGRYATGELPRALSLFVGNVQAAAFGLRRLDGQPDYNRIWPGAEETADIAASPEYQMMGQVVDAMHQRGVFASIDVHNNTGLNPHYGCVNDLRPEFLHLATLFSHTVVYFLRPVGVQSAAFAKICPAVTLECGKPGDAAAEEHATRFIEAVLHLDHFPEKPLATGDFNLFHTVATVKVDDERSFSFGEVEADLQLDPQIDHMNFRELDVGTCFGTVADGSPMPLVALAEDGSDVTTDYFEVRDSKLLLSRGAMPSMLTLDERIIRQDCLCYLMERYALP